MPSKWTGNVRAAAKFRRSKLLLGSMERPAGLASFISLGSTAPVHAEGRTAPPIKHVWLIILENKSYDATFTGLNKNTYLWQTLPSQGVLLKNYYGTGHFSLDNYISMVSGQAPQPDTQADCPFYDKFSGSVDKVGNVKKNPNYGQVLSPAGANAAAGT